MTASQRLYLLPWFVYFSTMPILSSVYYDRAI